MNEEDYDIARAMAGRPRRRNSLIIATVAILVAIALSTPLLLGMNLNAENTGPPADEVDENLEAVQPSGENNVVMDLYSKYNVSDPGFTPICPRSDAALLDPLCIPKYVNQLDSPPPVYVPTKMTDPTTGEEKWYYYVQMDEAYQQVLPDGFPTTLVYTYGGEAMDAVTGELLGFVKSSPGPSFYTVKGIAQEVKWVNKINTPHQFPVDPTLHWANPNNFVPPGMHDMHDTMPANACMPCIQAPPFPPGYPEAQYPVPLVTHVHGAEVQSTSDGNPDAWFTYNGIHGPAYSTEAPTEPNSAVFSYPNEQPATTLFYHDHSLGVTRLNVAAGLAGGWVIKNPCDPADTLMPTGKYDMPLIIQDRSFRVDGSMVFPDEGINPCVHPYWNPENFGDTIMVDGKVWPNMDVDRGVYLLRLVNGSNARFYTMSFSNGMPFTVVGSDGGYLRSAVTVDELTVAPGERYMVLVDFSAMSPCESVILQNTAAAPFPAGDPADPDTTGQIMQFTATNCDGIDMPCLPEVLNPQHAEGFPNLGSPDVVRRLTLNEIMGENGPLMLVLDGQRWSAPISEMPVEGTIEQWVVANPTMDTHPIHLHLVQFQVVSRQAFDVDAYMTDWLCANGMPPDPAAGLMAPLDHPTVPICTENYLLGEPTGPNPEETGWKDTVKMNPGEVTVIKVRFSPVDGSKNYSFDPTEGPGYVWHCHILDHEDNEMMRPYVVVSAPKPDCE